MALNERTEFGAISIDADGVIHVRMDRVILDGTEEIARKYHRSVFTPDMDPATFPVRLRKIANAVWDAATIAAYRAKTGLI
jgi:hypothetical protein